MKSMHILIICTSHEDLGDTSLKTGLWLEELAAPYCIFKDSGARITLCSPAGGPIPVDPNSNKPESLTASTTRFGKDPEAVFALNNSIALGEIDPEGYDAVFIPGGHGPLWDLAGNAALKELLEKFNQAGKPIAAVCHGVAALISIQEPGGKRMIQGKRLTGFSNSEEELAGLCEVVPFLLESRLLSLGAFYSKGHDYASYVITDGNLVTGQNPASSGEAAERVMTMLRDLEHQLACRNKSKANNPEGHTIDILYNRV
jgi:putative intracellular protease/amidase